MEQQCKCSRRWLLVNWKCSNLGCYIINNNNNIHAWSCSSFTQLLCRATSSTGASLVLVFLIPSLLLLYKSLCVVFCALLCLQCGEAFMCFPQPARPGLQLFLEWRAVCERPRPATLCDIWEDGEIGIKWGKSQRFLPLPHGSSAPSPPALLHRGFRCRLQRSVSQCRDGSRAVHWAGSSLQPRPDFLAQ